eukprot:gene8184-199_t
MLRWDLAIPYLDGGRSTWISASPPVQPSKTIQQALPLTTPPAFAPLGRQVPVLPNQDSSPIQPTSPNVAYFDLMRKGVAPVSATHDGASQNFRSAAPKPPQQRSMLTHVSGQPGTARTPTPPNHAAAVGFESNMNTATPKSGSQLKEELLQQKKQLEVHLAALQAEEEQTQRKSISAQSRPRSPYKDFSQPQPRLNRSLSVDRHRGAPRSRLRSPHCNSSKSPADRHTKTFDPPFLGSRVARSRSTPAPTLRCKAQHQKTVGNSPRRLQRPYANTAVSLESLQEERDMIQEQMVELELAVASSMKEFQALHTIGDPELRHDQMIALQNRQMTEMKSLAAESQYHTKPYQAPGTPDFVRSHREEAEPVTNVRMSKATFSRLTQPRPEPKAPERTGPQPKRLSAKEEDAWVERMKNRVENDRKLKDKREATRLQAEAKLRDEGRFKEDVNWAGHLRDEVHGRDKKPKFVMSRRPSDLNHSPEPLERKPPAQRSTSGKPDIAVIDVRKLSPRYPRIHDRLFQQAETIQKKKEESPPAPKVHPSRDALSPEEKAKRHSTSWARIHKWKPTAPAQPEYSHQPEINATAEKKTPKRLSTALQEKQVLKLYRHKEIKEPEPGPTIHKNKIAQDKLQKKLNKLYKDHEVHQNKMEGIRQAQLEKDQEELARQRVPPSYHHWSPGTSVVSVQRPCPIQSAHQMHIGLPGTSPGSPGSGVQMMHLHGLDDGPEYDAEAARSPASAGMVRLSTPKPSGPSPWKPSPSHMNTLGAVSTAEELSSLLMDGATGTTNVIYVNSGRYFLSHCLSPLDTFELRMDKGCDIHFGGEIMEPNPLKVEQCDWSYDYNQIEAVEDLIIEGANFVSNVQLAACGGQLVLRKCNLSGVVLLAPEDGGTYVLEGCTIGSLFLECRRSHVLVRNCTLGAIDGSCAPRDTLINHLRHPDLSNCYRLASVEGVLFHLSCTGLDDLEIDLIPNIYEFSTSVCGLGHRIAANVYMKSAGAVFKFVNDGTGAKKVVVKVQMQPGKKIPPLFVGNSNITFEGITFESSCDYPGAASAMFSVQTGLAEFINCEFIGQDENTLLTVGEEAALKLDRCDVTGNSVLGLNCLIENIDISDSRFNGDLLDSKSLFSTA